MNTPDPQGCRVPIPWKVGMVFLLPLQGEGRDGDGVTSQPQGKYTHPHPNPPLEGEGN